MKNLRTLLGLLLMPAAASAASLYSPDLVLIKTDDCQSSSRSIINQPDGRYDADYPYNQFTVMAGFLGTDATGMAIEDPLAEYTGLDVRGASFVRGAQRNSTEPPTAFQISCGEAAFVVNTRQVQAAEASSAQYKVTWAIPSWAPLEPKIGAIIAEYQPTRVRSGAPEIRPWTQPGDPDLILQARVRVPVAEVTGKAHIQYNLSFYLLDTGSGEVFDYIVNLYNNDGFGPGNGPSHDGLSPFISIMLPPDGSAELHHRYYTLSPYSAGSSITTWDEPRFFRIHVGRQELLNAIDDVNDAYGTRLSADPSNYLLIDAGVMQEHARRPDASVVMGSSLEDFGVYVASNTEPAQLMLSPQRVPAAERTTRR